MIALGHRLSGLPSGAPKVPAVKTPLWEHQQDTVAQIFTGFTREGRKGFGDASCVGAGKTLTALAVIFVFWDTHRVVASVAVTATFFLIALIAGLVLRAKIRGKPPLLDATRAELAKDRAALMSKR